MRPSPRDVRTWFARCRAATTVAAHLTTLHADPNWGVRYTRGVSLSAFSLLYYPTGECIEGALLHVGTMCYPRLDTRSAAIG